MAPGLGEFYSSRLKTERYGGNFILMTADVAFTSLGLNHFTAVAPKVLEFSKGNYKFSKKRLIARNPLFYLRFLSKLRLKLMEVRVMAYTYVTIFLR